MSATLQFIDDEFKKKFQSDSSLNNSSQSVHEHAGKQLLYPTITIDKGKRDSHGEPILDTELNVIGRTELPNPSATSALIVYNEGYQKEFKRKGILGLLNDTYMSAMISNNRKGRTEFVMVSTASALNAQAVESAQLSKALQKS